VAALAHHGDEIAHLDRLVDVMGDEQDRLGQVRLEPEELVLEALADDRVDRPEGLVHEHERRVRREGTGDTDTLALATRELARISIPVGRRIEPHQGEELLAALATPRRAPAEEARHGRHVLADGLVGEQADLLDDVADGPSEVRELALGGILAVDEDPATRRLDEPVDHLEARRLAAA